MAALCPSCGYNLVAERPLVAGPFRYSPINGFSVNGVRLKMGPQPHGFMGAVMAARGDTVTYAAIGARIRDEDMPNGLLTGMRLAIEKRIVARGERMPVAATWGVGMRWIGPPVELEDLAS